MDATVLDTFQRDDGTMQVSYSGHPHYYAGGAAPGDPTGQGRNDA